MSPRRPLIVLAVLTGLAVLAAAVVIVVVLTTSGRDEPATLSPTQEQAPAGLARFYDQRVRWSECADGDARCGWIRVPIDYDEPAGPTLRLRAIWYPARQDPGGGRERAIFVNPGGPGASAVRFAQSFEGRLGSEVRDELGVIGVDPRGVGLSTPVRCLGDRAFDEYSASDPTPDDATERRANEQAAREFGEACVKNSPAGVAAHVSTKEAARDMDVTRAVTGQSRLDWFGGSYGTQLGATYATLFPTKVGRMVLDGATDPSLEPIESALGQATGFQDAFDAYAEDCARQQSCPLGTSVARARDRMTSFVDDLDSEPLSTGTPRELTQGRAFYGVAVTLYDRATWPVLTEALKQAFDGNGSLLLRLNDTYLQRQSDGSFASNLGQVITAVNCLDSRQRPTVAQVEAELPRFDEASPVFGRPLAYGAAACADWPEPVTNPQPRIDAKGAPPILVIGTTNDPATPYVYAPRLAKALRVGVLVTRVGEGHTAYTSGNACITRIVDDFFADDTVPRNGTACR